MSKIIAFLRAIAQNPGDEALRLVFADWLEEQGDWRGEFLRLDCQLRGATRSGECDANLWRRWAELRSGLSPSWRTVLDRPGIENCGVRFKFRCPQRWDKLQPAQLAGVRFCPACRKSVYYCTTLEEVQGQAANGNCVAVDAAVARFPGDLEGGVELIGQVLDDDFTED